MKPAKRDLTRTRNYPRGQGKSRGASNKGDAGCEKHLDDVDSDISNQLCFNDRIRDVSI